MRYPFAFPATRRGGAVLAALALSTSLLAAEDNAAAFAAVKAAVAANRLQKTPTVGGFGREPYSETASQPCVLIGFEFGLGKAAKTEVILALRAIYLTPDGPRLGPAHGLFTSPAAKGPRSKVTRVVKVQAKPGYAVGGLTGRALFVINGLSLRFDRINGTKLDASDSYRSEWIGDKTAGSEVSFDTRGTLAVGIHGKANPAECTALGLVRMTPPPETAVVAAPPTPPAARPKPKPAEAAPPVAAVQPPEAPALTPEPEPTPVTPPSPKPSAAPAARPTPLAAQAQDQNAGVWVLPAALGLIVTVLGVGGAMMFTASKEAVAEPATLPERVSASEPCVNLPPEIEDRVRAELADGEELIWAGQPSPRATRLKSLAVMAACLGVALLGGAIAAVWLVLSKGSVIPMVVGAVFALIGFGGAIMAPINQRFLARHTCHAVTNRRAIVLRPSLFGTAAVDSYGPVQLQQMVRRDWWFTRGVGDLIFHTEKTLEVTTTRGRHGSSSSVREKIVHFGFLGIDEPGRVEKVVRRVLVNPLVDKIQA